MTDEIDPVLWAQMEALGDSLIHWSDLWYIMRMPKDKRPKEWDRFIYSVECACCRRYSYDAESQCPGCPVLEYYGLPMCEETPWEAVHTEVRREAHGKPYSAMPLMEAVEYEYKFLSDVFFHLMRKVQASISP